MTDQQHPITPPPELVQQWASEFYGTIIGHGEASIAIADQAARWGADQQLEQCVAWLDGYEHKGWAAEQMRNDCRPKPPSLKEQALQALAELAAECYGNTDQSDTIRRALEKLDD